MRAKQRCEKVAELRGQSESANQDR